MASNVISNRLKRHCSPLFMVWLLIAGLAGMAGIVVAQKIEWPEPSSYAPVRDIEQQLEYFQKQIAKDLEQPEDFGDDQRDRIDKNASTLAVLALVLAHHNEDSPLKASATAMIPAAQRLAAASQDYKQAHEAMESLRKVEKQEGDPSVEWEPVADLSVLMKQVPIVNNRLRRGVNGRRFRRSLNQNAGLAATLASLAQASALDTTYCDDEEDEKAWRLICSDMRDTAAMVNAAVRDMDQKGAKVALQRLAESCDACHHRFRDE